MLRVVDDSAPPVTVSGDAVCRELLTLLGERLPLVPVTDERRGTLYALYVGLGGSGAV